MTTRYELVTVSGGSCIPISTLLGDGKPRLFEGSGLYVYGLNKALWKSSDLVTFDNILTTNTVMAMAQTYETPQKTVVLISSGSTTTKTGKYQAVPESAGGWASTGSLPAGFSAVDAVADAAQKIGVLAGNGIKGSTARVVKSTQVSPYSFASSSTGLPTNAVTDLEL